MAGRWKVFVVKDEIGVNPVKAKPVYTSIRRLPLEGDRGTAGRTSDGLIGLPGHLLTGVMPHLCVVR